MWLSVKHLNYKDFLDISNIYSVCCVFAVSRACSLGTPLVLIVPAVDLICNGNMKGACDSCLGDSNSTSGEENAVYTDDHLI